MKKTLLVASFALLSGCMIVPSPVPGIWYTDVKYPSYYQGAAEKGPGSKSGMAEAQTILGLIATGDASIDAACKAGGISSINTVDHKGWQVLGVFGKWTTLVTGE